ncbi:hypothetical protein ACFRSX_32925 [Streptomyces goshikiensis]|uniref:hypothetical protein n=1 Tax=Streptomyces TaxID=1883 RepID=UPI000C276155|nr:hypothetical protein [Streptomyces sp. CB02120-2]PJN14580.1 hypothetical protein CG724_33370 [Streptomyces sp. CB02120-2]
MDRKQIGRAPEGNDKFVNVTLWFPSHWKDSSDVDWSTNNGVPWAFRRVPREGEQLFWQDSHRFEVVGVVHRTGDHSPSSVHLSVDPATDADRRHLRTVGGLCLRDQLILARASGTSWDALAELYEILPSALLRYVRDQKDLADDRDLVAEVVEGGEDGVGISDLDRAAVLAALWNHLQPGYQARSEPLSIDEARNVLAERAGHISTLHGRTLQVVLTGNRFNPWLYDQEASNGDHEDRGHLTAQAVVEHLRATGSVTGAPRPTE